MQLTNEIKSALKSNQDTLNGFLDYISEEDLAVRQPFSNSPNIAWQMGRLITAEVGMGAAVPGAGYPELPAGMKEAYGSNTWLDVPPGGYLKKAEYLELFNKVRSATLGALDSLTDADLDKPTTGPMASLAPTLNDLLWLIAQHTALTISGLRTSSPEVP